MVTVSFFFHPDFTVGSGIDAFLNETALTRSAALRRVADFTAGREFFHSRKSPCPEESPYAVHCYHTAAGGACQDLCPAFFRQAIGKKPQEAVALT